MTNEKTYSSLCIVNWELHHKINKTYMTLEDFLVNTPKWGNYNPDKA